MPRSRMYYVTADRSKPVGGHGTEQPIAASKCCVGTIIDFIDARLREDEHAAQAVGGAQRVWSFQGDDHTARAGTQVLVTAGDAGARIARHDPGQVLREVLSKRLIVTLAQLPPGAERQDRLLRCVALCWADHAEYRAEWIL